mgnify:CR=1 FL=1
MNYYSSKFNNLFFIFTLIIAMLLGIIFSMIYSKSLKKKFFINMDTLENSYPQYSGKFVEQNSSFHELEVQNYPENSVPIKITLGKIKKVENPYQPRLNLSFLRKNFDSGNSLNNLRFSSNIMGNIEYEYFNKYNR